MKMLRYAFLLLITIPFVSNAQTIIIDYSEKMLDDEYMIHFAQPGTPTSTKSFDNVKDAKAELIKIFEIYLAEGYQVMTSNISSHKDRSWFKTGMHYHYQYILQDVRHNQIPIMPSMGQEGPGPDKGGIRKRNDRKSGRDRMQSDPKHGKGAQRGTGGGNGEGSGGGRNRMSTPDAPTNNPNSGGSATIQANPK